MVEFLCILKRRPHRASCIRELILRLDDLNSSPEDFAIRVAEVWLSGFWDDDAPNSSIEALSQILGRTSRLETLTLDQPIPFCRFDPPSASWCLASNSFSSLKSLSITGFTNQHFEFLLAHPKITSYKIIQLTDELDEMALVAELPSSLLPVLQSLTSTASEAIKLIPGRPVHTVEITPILYSSQVANLGHALLTSTVTVTRLDLPVIPEQNLADVLELLATPLLHLRYLTISLELVAPIRHPAESLSRFPQLHTLTIRDTSRVDWPLIWKLHFMIACSKFHPCMSLRNIDFRVGRTTAEQERHSDQFSRDSSHAKWLGQDNDGKILDMIELIRYVIFFYQRDELPTDIYDSIIGNSMRTLWNTDGGWRHWFLKVYEGPGQFFLVGCLHPSCFLRI